MLDGAIDVTVGETVEQEGFAYADLFRPPVQAAG